MSEEEISNRVFFKGFRTSRVAKGFSPVKLNRNTFSIDFIFGVWCNIAQKILFPKIHSLVAPNIEKFSVF